MKYRFFGTRTPPKDDVNTFLQYDSMIVEAYVDQDKIYYQILKLHRKCFFEWTKYGESVISKRERYELLWSTHETLAQSFELIIDGLKHSKEVYHQNSSRFKARLAAKAAKAAKAAQLKRRKVQPAEDEEEESGEEGDQSHNHNQRRRGRGGRRRRRRRSSKVFFLLYYNSIFKFALIINRKKPVIMKEVINQVKQDRYQRRKQMINRVKQDQRRKRMVQIQQQWRIEKKRKRRRKKRRRNKHQRVLLIQEREEGGNMKEVYSSNHHYQQQFVDLHIDHLMQHHQIKKPKPITIRIATSM